MTTKKKNSGFTLTELIIAIVISSIVLTLISYFFVRFINISNDVKKERNKTYEQNIITKYFDDLENFVNLNGYGVNINYSNNVIYYQDENKAMGLINSIIIDNTNKTLKCNDKLILEFNSIKTVHIKESVHTSNIFLVEITFNDDSTYVFSNYIINGIGKE